METSGLMPVLAPLQFGQPFSPFNAVSSGASILDVTNPQKLALTGITTGQQVRISDGFVVSGAGTEVSNGFYTERGIHEGKKTYNLAGSPTHPDLSVVFWNGFNWYIQDPIALTLYSSSQDVEFPWQVTVWENGGDGTEPLPTLTHPAIQQLAAPSTAQGGVFVSGGTQDGVYLKAVGSGSVPGRNLFNQLGTDQTGETDTNEVTPVTNIAEIIGHGSLTIGWLMWDAGSNPSYYSASDVATPDLATNWKNASDDSPASITVSSLTVGQLVSGWKLGSVVYQVNGNLNGRNLYSDVLGVAPNLGWDNVKWTDGTTNGSGNTALPDIGTSDPVASESNWSVTP